MWVSAHPHHNITPISLLRVISKLFEAIINKKVVNDLNSNKLLSDKVPLDP